MGEALHQLIRVYLGTHMRHDIVVDDIRDYYSRLLLRRLHWYTCVLMMLKRWTSGAMFGAPVCMSTE